MWEKSPEFASTGKEGWLELGRTCQSGITAPATRFSLIDNDGYDVSLDVGKVYQALPTEKISRDDGLLRVIDNEGEDYLYSADHFVEVQLPRAAREAVLRAR